MREEVEMVECLNGFGHGFPFVKKHVAFLGYSVFDWAVVDL